MSSLLEDLYHDHKSLRKCAQGESFCRYSPVQCVLKTCWKHVNNPYFPWMIHREDVLKTSRRCLENILKTSWRWLPDMLKKTSLSSVEHLEDVLKTSWRRLEDVLNTFWTYLENAGVQLVFFKARAQISMIGHMHFHNLIWYPVELVKCCFFHSTSWYKIYCQKTSKTPAKECDFKSKFLLKLTLFLKCFWRFLKRRFFDVF